MAHAAERVRIPTPEESTPHNGARGVAGLVECRERPDVRGVVVKHDDSGAGDGNAVLDLRGDIRAAVEGLPAWYRRDLAAGGVVEERISGAEFSSPSAQVDVLPDGRVVLLATHEQELDGKDGQVYVGCRFPADPAYAAEIGRHAVATGERSIAVLTFANVTREAADDWIGTGIADTSRPRAGTAPVAAMSAAAVSAQKPGTPAARPDEPSDMTRRCPSTAAARPRMRVTKSETEVYRSWSGAATRSTLRA